MTPAVKEKNAAPGHVRRVVDGRVRVDRRAVDDRRAVRRHVDDLRVRRLDDDDFLRLDDLRLDLLLLGRLQGVVVLRLLPHPLAGVHDVGLLGEEGVAEVGRPLDVVGEPLHGVGEGGHRLDGRVPRLLGDGVRERLVLQVRVLRHPLLELDELERVGGRRERLGEERVGVERDRRHEGVELLRRELRRGLRRRGGGLRASAGGAAWARTTPSPGTRRHAHATARSAPRDAVEGFGMGTVRSPSFWLPFLPGSCCEVRRGCPSKSPERVRRESRRKGYAVARPRRAVRRRTARGPGAAGPRRRRRPCSIRCPQMYWIAELAAPDRCPDEVEAEAVRRPVGAGRPGSRGCRRARRPRRATSEGRPARGSSRASGGGRQPYQPQCERSSSSPVAGSKAPSCPPAEFRSLMKRAIPSRRSPGT